MSPRPIANRLLEGPILGSMLALAAPIVIANVLQAAYQIIDAFWVGRVGGHAVAAVSVSFPVLFFSFALGGGFAMAGSTLIAQYFGARNHEMVSHVAAQTLLSVIVISAVLGVLGFLATPGLLTLMGVQPDVYDAALGFMRVAFLGIVFNFTFFMFQSIMRGVGEATLPVWIVLATVILNFGLDPLFIFGGFGVPAMGVMGAALATIVTQSLAAIAGLIVLFGGKYGIHLRWRDFAPGFAFIRRAFFLGLPASVEMSARAGGMMVMTFLVASFGTLAIAAYGVGGNILQMVMIPAMGLSMAVATLAGQNIGAGQIPRAAEIGKMGAWVGFWVLTVFGVVVFAFAPAFIAFFVPNDPDVIAEGAHFLRIIALVWGLFGVQLALIGVVRAAGEMVVAMALTLVGQWVLQFPLAYVLAKHTPLGVEGVWWSFPITGVIMTLCVIAIFLKGDWKKKRLTDPEQKLTEKVTEETLTEEGFTNRGP